MGACMSALNEHKLKEVIKKAAKEKPFLGICLGLQLLFDFSEENNGTKGLSIIPGNVIKFKNNELKIPHMGWNKVKQVIITHFGVKLKIIRGFIASIVIMLRKITKVMLQVRLNMASNLLQL
jgi:imidazoleglycerol phosphate synthase glutamine amidotransferase subunit HisH